MKLQKNLDITVIAFGLGQKCSKIHSVSAKRCMTVGASSSRVFCYSALASTLFRRIIRYGCQPRRIKTLNAVEIEKAVAELARQPFDAEEFPFAFLTAFGNHETTIRQLRYGNANKSDVGGVLQANSIHIKAITLCAIGKTLIESGDGTRTIKNTALGAVSKTLAELGSSLATRNKCHQVRYLLATDGVKFEAEDLATGDTVACDYADFPSHFGFFLPLASITKIKEIQENELDRKATQELTKLYEELLKHDPDWRGEVRCHDMNRFIAKLIFCFFAEGTGIFGDENLFANSIKQMSASDSSNTHEVIGEIFRAMNTAIPDRADACLAKWADRFPYVNGGVFAGSHDVPRFSENARAYLLHIGEIDWRRINPDIFGSMIQTMADDGERGALGMHYTSVPNILKVLNPLFLDDLRASLEDAGDDAQKLLNLRKRMSSIRIFDPACGSGNFLVIAYKEMRAIEAEINIRRREAYRKTDIPLTNFRGIEIRGFSAEIARLALIIAKFQCDMLHCGRKEAVAEFLPLNEQNWITCGNALRLDWLKICPPTGTAVRIKADDLFGTPLDQAEIDFANNGGETYICGNPPYLGSKWQSKSQKEDMKSLFQARVAGWKSLDYVSGWFLKAADYGVATKSAAAFVSTNSINQGQQVPILWPVIFETGHEIFFAHTSFRWSNLASQNAGVMVAIVGIAINPKGKRKIYSLSSKNEPVVQEVANINAYLVPGSMATVEPARAPNSEAAKMVFGNMPRDGGHFILSAEERRHVLEDFPEVEPFIRPYFGSEQMIQGKPRWCFWIEDTEVEEASKHPVLCSAMGRVRAFRLSSAASSTRDFASMPHRFVQIAGTAKQHSIAVAKVSSEKRDYLPVDLFDERTIISDLLFALYDAPIWNLAIIASRLHMAWIATVCGKLKTDYRYSNTLGWNTFPIPRLTEKNRDDLSQCAKDILLSRKAHFPRTLAELYNPVKMPDNLRAAHNRNDEVLERIYVGRRFKNDTERLEMLFELYSKNRQRIAV